MIRQPETLISQRTLKNSLLFNLLISWDKNFPQKHQLFKPQKFRLGFHLLMFAQVAWKLKLSKWNYFLVDIPSVKNVIDNKKTFSPFDLKIFLL